jgi:hypothetical protein
MDEDFHIISGTDKNKKKNGSFFKYAPFLLILLLAGIVVRNISLLQKQRVEGAQTENKEEQSDSIRFDTPEESEPFDKGSPSPSTKPGGKEEKTASKTLLVKSIESGDGFVGSEGIVGVNTAIKVGDDGENNYRGFVNFTLDTIPQGAVIQKGTLRIYQTEVKGNPFGIHGAMKIDHVVLGTTLTQESFSKESEDKSFASIPQTTIAGWKEIDVTKELNRDLNEARTRSQYRIHFENERAKGDGSENLVIFESASNSELSGETPQLVVSY